MPLHGDLGTMSLSDLLRWADANKKTGVLELERHKICRRVEFRKGWIGACSSSDPASRLGQFLLSRGKITEGVLRNALERQREHRKNLGWILLDMGILTRKELSRLITAKAEETMHGLFEWDEDAVFRFNSGATLDPDHIEVSLSVDDIIERGYRRVQELQAIRRNLTSSGMVLRRRDGIDRVPALQKPQARRILDAIDGERSISEILLHARASQFNVLKFVDQLLRKNLVEVVSVREEKPEFPTLLDTEDLDGGARDGWTAGDLSDEALDSFAGPDVDERDHPIPEFHLERQPTADELHAEVEVAARMLDREEYDAALELLNASYRASPHDESVRKMLRRAESDYVDDARRRGLSFDRIPVLVPGAEDLPREGLRPEDAFLASVIDGRLDIQSILWITPLREIDVLMALRRLIDHGVVALAGGCETATPEPVAG